MFTSNIISNYAICYSMYFIMIWIIYLNNSHQLFDQKGLPAKNPGNLLALQIAGILWLGLVPLIWAKPILKIIFGEGKTGTEFILSFISVLLFLIFTGIHQAKETVKVSQKITLPSRSYLSRYFILRIPFLLSYEIFFRGLLLFLNIEKFGLVVAILIDMLLNFILHAFSGKKMQWACIPFSLIACLLNYQAQAVWPSIILHLAISISFELTSVKRVFNHLKAIS